MFHCSVTQRHRLGTANCCIQRIDFLPLHFRGEILWRTKFYSIVIVIVKEKVSDLQGTKSIIHGLFILTPIATHTRKRIPQIEESCKAINSIPIATVARTSFQRWE